MFLDSDEKFDYSVFNLPLDFDIHKYREFDEDYYKRDNRINKVVYLNSFKLHGFIRKEIFDVFKEYLSPKNFYYDGFWIFRHRVFKRSIKEFLNDDFYKKVYGLDWEEAKDAISELLPRGLPGCDYRFELFLNLIEKCINGDFEEIFNEMYYNERVIEEQGQDFIDYKNSWKTRYVYINMETSAAQGESLKDAREAWANLVPALKYLFETNDKNLCDSDNYDYVNILLSRYPECVFCFNCDYLIKYNEKEDENLYYGLGKYNTNNSEFEELKLVFKKNDSYDYVLVKQLREWEYE